MRRTFTTRAASKSMLSKREVRARPSQRGIRTTRGVVPLTEHEIPGRSPYFRHPMGILASTLLQLVFKSPTSLAQGSKTPQQTYEK